MKRRLSIFWAMASFACMHSGLPAHAQVDVSGAVSFYIDTDADGNLLPAEKRRYVPLEGVEVNAVRGVVVATTHSQGAPNVGAFAFEKDDPEKVIPEGPPANILFIHKQNKYVPVLMQLTCSQKRKQCLHVTVLTPDQFKRIYGQEAYVRHLGVLRAHLQNLDGERGGRLRTMFQEFVRMWGVN